MYSNYSVCTLEYIVQNNLFPLIFQRIVCSISLSPLEAPFQWSALWRNKPCSLFSCCLSLCSPAAHCQKQQQCLQKNHVILIHSTPQKMKFILPSGLIQFNLPHNDALIIKFSLWRSHNCIFLTRHLDHRMIGQALGHVIHDTWQQFSWRQNR